MRLLAALAVGVILSASFAEAAVVSRVADIAAGPQGSGPSFLTVFDGQLYFRAFSATTGIELWRYDGSSVALAADLNAGAASSTPAHLAEYNGRLYFQATVPPVGSSRLWRFDGTTGSPAPDPVGQNATNAEDLIAFGGTLFFRAFRSGLGSELWKFDGATQTPLDLFPGSGSSLPKEFVEFGGQLYMNVLNQELHRLNPTQSGVVQVTNIGGGNGGSPEHPAVFDGKLYFSANDSVHGRELWRFDGSTAELAADIVPGDQFTSSNPTELTPFGGALYFSAEHPVEGFELWQFDGTSAEMVANINPLPIEPGVDPVHHSNPSEFMVLGDRLYFAADDGTHGRELWSFDGTTARLEADINPGPFGSDPADLRVFNGLLYFRATEGEFGQELYVLNPVPEPAALLLALPAALAVIAIVVRRIHQRRI